MSNKNNDNVVHDSHPTYRSDIDGLRAIAVLSVVVFHAFPSKMPGGFIGVDIFFVISGYLISSILIKSIGTGQFTFADFYGRRARRIFPALVLVLTACLVAGWFVLLPADFRQLGTHVAAGAAFISNFILWGESGYFERAADLKILLHLWSLAIEEQFYIVWPILLIAAHRLRLGIGRTIILTGVASFAFGIWSIGADPIAAFFNPLARAWELLVGAGVAYFFCVRCGVIPSRSGHVLSIVGTALIGTALALLDKSSTFPGLAALLPTLGTAALILAGPGAIINRIILANPLMVGIGLISYPMYLWHWPLLVFPRIIEGGTPATAVRIAAMALAIVLAWLTYLLVERKLRAGRFQAMKAMALAASVAACGVFGFGVMRAEGLPARASIAGYEDVDEMLAAATAWPYAENSTCLNRYPSSYRKEGWWFCVMNKDAPPTLMLMGNSFANHLYPGIANNPAFADQTILQFGICDPAMGITFSAYRVDHPCYGEGRRMQEELSSKVLEQSPTIRVVILSAPWPFFNERGDALDYFDPNKIDGIYAAADGSRGTSYDVFMRGLERRIAFLIAHRVTPVLFFSTPELGYSPLTCYSSQPYRNKTEQNSCTVSRAQEERLQARFRAGVEEIKLRHPELKVFDPLPALCDDEDCRLKTPRGPLLRDLGHLSLAGSNVVGEAFAGWAANNLPELSVK